MRIFILIFLMFMAALAALDAARRGYEGMLDRNEVAISEWDQCGCECYE